MSPQGAEIMMGKTEPGVAQDAQKRGESRDLDLVCTKVDLIAHVCWSAASRVIVYPSRRAFGEGGHLHREMLPDNPSFSPTYDATPPPNSLDPESFRRAGGTTTGTQPLVPASELHQFQLTAP